MTRTERRRLTLLWILSVVFASGSAAVCALSWHVHSRHHAAGAVPAAAPEPEHAAEERLFMWLLNGKSGADLTPARREALEKLRSALLASTAARQPEMRAARREIAEALASGNAAAPALEPALRILARAQAERQRALIDCCFDIHGILTAEQRGDFLQWVDANLLHRQSFHEPSR